MKGTKSSFSIGRISLGLSLIVMMVLSLFGCAGARGEMQTNTPQTSGSVAGVDLDTAVKELAAQIDRKLPQGTKVALVSVASPSTAFSEQVLLRLESALVSTGKVVIVDRANLDKVRAEQGFQLSGEVDDDSAKAIGKLLGAGAIVTGSTVDMGDVYGLALKAIHIETATVAVSYLADLTKTERIKTLMASGGGTSTSQRTAQGSSGTTQAQAAPVEPSGPVVYKIGDKGPAGGWIFYDKGNNSEGWRYLEAAPASTETKVQWAVSNGVVGGTKTELGVGKKNTQLIVDYSLRTGQNMPAARYCDRLQSNGYDDWFLPSKLELGLMFLNLKDAGIGGFGNDVYWSSSEEDSYRDYAVWGQNFRNGAQGYYNEFNKDNTNSVRAVRAF